MIVGGEVDCVHEGAGVETGLDVSAFIELKTNLVIEGPRDEMRFERCGYSAIANPSMLTIDFQIQASEALYSE